MFKKHITLIAIFMSLNGILATLELLEDLDMLRFVSVDSDTYEKEFEIKIIKHENNSCANVNTVTLDNMDLKVLKNDIVQSDTIQKISLKNNHFQNIPNNILDYVPHLICFDLHRNWINLYDGNKLSIHHNYLRALNLSNQNVFSHQLILWEIENRVRIEGNTYKYMVFNSSRMRLPYLEHLDISGYDVSALSWDFNISFPRLTHLYLTNINAERVEPHFFKKIPPSLQVLHLENNRFRNLSLNNLMDITAIYLDGNKHLKNIEISSSKLRTLSFSNCSFTELGYIDLKTPYLEKLDMSNNSLESTSYFRFQNYQTLQILLLNNNKFSEIPLLNLQRLTELSLSYNMIKYILPERFLYLISLQKLSLKGNIIENIESNAFSGLTKLKYLDLSANQLRTLSSDFLLPVISLQYLNLNSNQFKHFSDIGFVYSNKSYDYLKHLFVKNNIFSSISTIDLAYLPSHVSVYIA